jgi:hypothetical protein
MTDSEFLIACACLTDFDLCNALASAVEEKYGYPVYKSDLVSVPERVVSVVWSLQGFAEGDGLAALLEAEADGLPSLEDAFQVIGMPEQAHIVKRLRTNPPSDTELPDMETRFFKLGKSTERQLAKYVRQRLGDFSHLELPRRDSDWEQENTAYLYSMSTWSHSFADEHSGRIPSLGELKAFCMHDGIKDVSPEDYTVLIDGTFAQHAETEPHIAYNQPVGGKMYCVTVEGRIKEQESS